MRELDTGQQDVRGGVRPEYQYINRYIYSYIKQKKVAYTLA